LQVLDKFFKKIGYSITSLSGHSSISFDYQNKFIPSGNFESFDKELYDRWKDCLTGGIVEVTHLNKRNVSVFCYDINGTRIC